jgi:lipopolysaccharide transport system permease protein
MFKEIISDRYLLIQITKKEIQSRYKGSYLGIMWSFIVPLLMLTIYTFVFSEVFEVKWSIDTTSKFDFAIILFCGLNAFNMFAEVTNKSTVIIASNTNYVKKVIFPLGILPMAISLSALFNCIIGYFILVIANLILNGFISAYAYLIIFAIVPLIIFTIGISYIISGISVYLKDMNNIVNILTIVLMYMSPIFYSLDGVPEGFVVFCKMNPITYIIENIRNVLVYNKTIDLPSFGVSMIISTIVYILGYYIFNKVKDGFADVL